MSITITINDINNLTDMDRAVLRLVADNSVAASLKETVRGMTWLRDTGNGVVRVSDEESTPSCTSCDMTDVQKCSPQTPCFAPTQDKELVECTAYLPFCSDTHVGPNAELSPHLRALVEQLTVPTVPASAELDASGLPWDKRIHSSSRAKVANGNWRYARNLEGSVILAVEAELRGVQQIAAFTQPLPQLASTPNDGDDVVTAPTPVNTAQVFTVPVPPVPVASVPTPPVVPVPAIPTPVAAMTFAQMMQRITPQIVAGTLTQARVNEVCASYGLPHLAALGARPDLIPQALAALEAK
jgi:hypothetical protein